MYPAPAPAPYLDQRAPGCGLSLQECEALRTRAFTQQLLTVSLASAPVVRQTMEFGVGSMDEGWLGLLKEYWEKVCDCLHLITECCGLRFPLSDVEW